MSIQKKLHFLIIDDNQDYINLTKYVFEKAGYSATIMASSVDALEKIIELQPDCVLSDLVMPTLDGLELYKKIRSIPNIKQPTFIIVSGKVYDFDRDRAFEIGVDGYLTKPYEPKKFIQDVLEIMDQKMHVQFWGVRGTFPVPGKETVNYGGNTNCVSLALPKNQFFIFDGGTGIRALSNYLLVQKKLPISAKIFITHFHWDHINGIPFFVPFYLKGNEFEIYAPKQINQSVDELLFSQMNNVYFPVTRKEFSAKISFHELTEEYFEINDIKISTIFLNHPGNCLGYRIEYKNKIFCYITDNELYLLDSPYYKEFELDRLVQFIFNSDIVIMDSTYSDHEYHKKINWGHSCVSRVVDICNKAKVKLVCLYHHDPDEIDADIDKKLNQANTLLQELHSETRCIAPHEGDIIDI